STLAPRWPARYARAPPPASARRNQSLPRRAYTTVGAPVARPWVWMIRRAVILAAGQGSRMGGALPKPLVRVAGIALAERAVRSLLAVGIHEIAMVVGYRAREVIAALEHLPVEFIQNDEFLQPNGVSVCAAESFVEERSLLVMADHVFPP